MTASLEEARRKREESEVTARDAQRAEQRELERQLCEQAKQGDKQALAKLLRMHGPMLYRAVLLPRLGSDAAAQDALADTYVRVLERFEQFQWQGHGIYPWLRVVALRIALDRLRKRKRETLFGPDDLSRAVDAAEQDQQEGIDTQLCARRDLDAARQRLEQALSRLNERYAKAIRLRILAEVPREEAAAALGVSVATFDVVLHRALKSLKKTIAAQEVSHGK